MYLRIFSPDDFSSGGDETQLADVDLEDGSLGDDPQAGVHGGGWVALDPNDGKVEGRVQLGVGHVRLLEPKTHGPDEPVRQQILNCLKKVGTVFLYTRYDI